MHGKIKILLIEDSNSDILLFREALDSDGSFFKNKYDLIVMTDGEKALQSLKVNEHKDIKLIFLDVNLPKIKGEQILSFLKESDVYKKIPVIVLSASNDNTVIDKMYSLHANCYIVKPNYFDIFVNILSCIWNIWIKTERSS